MDVLIEDEDNGTPLDVIKRRLSLRLRLKTLTVGLPSPAFHVEMIATAKLQFSYRSVTPFTLQRKSISYNLWLHCYWTRG